LFGNNVDRLAAVDHMNAQGKPLGLREKAASDSDVKRIGLGFKARTIGLTGKTDAWLDIEEDGDVGNKAARCELVQVVDPWNIQPAPPALIRRRGVGVTIAQDDSSGVQVRLDDFLDVLCAVREHDQEFAARMRNESAVEHQLSECAAQPAATRLARHKHIAAPGGDQPVAKEADLSRLSGAVAAFEGDETTTGG
jgi:hypothetical protein